MSFEQQKLLFLLLLFIYALLPSFHCSINPSTGGQKDEQGSSTYWHLVSTEEGSGQEEAEELLPSERLGPGRAYQVVVGREEAAEHQQREMNKAQPEGMVDPTNRVKLAQEEVEEQEKLLVVQLAQGGNVAVANATSEEEEQRTPQVEQLEVFGMEEEEMTITASRSRKISTGGATTPTKPSLLLPPPGFELIDVGDNDDDDDDQGHEEEGGKGAEFEAIGKTSNPLIEWKSRRRDFTRAPKPHRPEEDEEKVGLVASGSGPSDEQVEEEEEEEENNNLPNVPVPPPARPEMQKARQTVVATPSAVTSTAPTTTDTTDRGQQQADRWQAPIPGPKGDKGGPGAPGMCASVDCPMPPPGPPGLPGLPGSPGAFAGLNDFDLRRIAAWPGVKGEKGECQQQQMDERGEEEQQGGGGDQILLLNGHNQRQRLSPPYDNSQQRNYGHQRTATGGEQGQKGDQGPPGPMGPPGQPAPPPVHRQFLQAPQTSAAPVSVHQTAIELLAAASSSPIGSLAFAVSTQQLFLRVHAGWRQVMLSQTTAPDPVHQQQAVHQAPAASVSEFLLQPLPIGSKMMLCDEPVQHPNVQPDTSTNSELSRLAYWLALDESNGDLSPPGNGLLDEFTAEGAAMPALHPIQAPAPIKLPADERRPRWPPKEVRPLMEEFEAEQERKKAKNRVEPQIRHKDRVLHLVALNEPLNGDFGGVRGADLECYRQARQFGFGTTFRAFLSSRVQDLNKLVHYDDRHHTPVVNLRGERLFDSWDSIFDGVVHTHVPVYSFNRQDIYSDSTWSDRWLWHGSSIDGIRSSTYCSEWRSSSPSMFGRASPLHLRHALTDRSNELSCNRRLAILCVEVMSKFNVDLKLGKRFMADLRL